ncbi:phosphoglycerate dehydrogenase [Nesterenkonia lacusekhoensis]|uniref:D-3-phosphoglycerate dehydrogenase n=1 Tax=Nesterenkonia lacusekhoensis TaxID=150832 RepID=A0ABS4T1P4_9MICC|nr:phosphoglycerate dehydrogenase [Nesterenkonia lacusekhoensis]MBP2318372.1 D-3-phosphoglycerate dehydrogenase [Nesterenkonia lacusekhoensis]
MSTRPVVVLAEELSPATVEALGPDFEIRQSDGSDRARLFADLADADAIMVRSATQVDAEVFAQAPQLKVVARAGVGLDNVDVKAATEAGVMVVNAPTSNIVSAAELTCAHILGLARNISPAHEALKAGEWKRSKYSGVELQDKVLGVIGLGRIGGLVAERMKAFGMEIIAFDPYVTSARAHQLGAQLVTLEELYEQADVVTVHMPKTPETIGMIGTEQFRTMKSSAFVVNVARGGLVDEQALEAALEAGEIGGAAIDVFSTEPSTDLPFFSRENVVVTPHLGASTAEAQEKAGVSVAKSVRLALAGELVPDAVNVAGGAIDELVRPGIPLIEKLGRVLNALASDAFTDVETEAAGEIAELNVSALQLAALKGLFTDVVSEQVSYVNAPVLAEQRGIATRLTTTSEVEDYRNALTVRGATSSGTNLEVRGTLTGPKQIEKIVGINGYDLEVTLTDHLVIFEYADRPGVVGALGRILGEKGVNIAGMQVSQSFKQGSALAVLAVDAALPAGVLDEIAAEVGATLAAEVDLEEHQ